MRSWLEILPWNREEFEQHPRAVTEMLLLKLSIADLELSFSWSPACLPGTVPQNHRPTIRLHALGLGQAAQTASGSTAQGPTHQAGGGSVSLSSASTDSACGAGSSALLLAEAAGTGSCG